MLLSIVIPSLNTKGHLERMLSSLSSSASRESLEIIVVDMSSTDGTLEMLRSLFPEVVILEDVPNKGYGAAANAGMAKAEGTHVLVANSDLVFPEGSIDRIVELLQQVDDNTLLGFRLEGLDGVLQRSALRLPRPFDLVWLFSATVRSSWPLSRRLGGYLNDWAMTQMTSVGWVTGAALAASRSLFQRLGGFDERFFMCSEEIDLCKRVHDLGGSVIYAPEVTLVHVGGASSSDKDRRVRWVTAGKVRYTRKHFGRLVLFAARLGAVATYLSSLAIWIARWMLRRITWRYVRIEARRYGAALLEAWRT